MAEAVSDSTPFFSDDQLAQFQRDGFLLVKQLLDAEETSLLQQTVRADQRMREHAMDVKDTAGRRTNLTLWNHPGDDIYGAIARSERIAGALEQLLGDEVYHYHSKLSAKEPRVGGAWEWHQDYGYWYNNGCLFPDMASLFIAIDPNTRENGCMQVLTGSHHLGRIEHGRFGEQTGADPERVAVAKERLPLVYCTMDPGDGLFFHSNLLHASDANLSEHARWSLLCCYNTRTNNPYKESHHPRYTPLKKLPHTAIRTAGLAGAQAGQKFLKQEEDRTTSTRRETTSE
ncbi:phytanoyl-CoA dioxygenase family protein [Lignipirellula cremea]|uniref:1-deoxypentalenic acid 11-beta-hydroxylase n=1 Tax=Lignipirellula cremea TaxID=2528010 RepID=A0A518DND1_9BACT|nr:phytanoyl-CoA dioxygenase family protein [Lignipirellula cremea]QDU93342.1 1-deoxypentalenic acid 11-beta-hydroxylase [Lignipirellula cremea]